jgi:LysM repeat protein
MKGINQALLGVLAALISAAIVLGSLLLSLVEGGQALAILPAGHFTPTPPLMTLPPGAPTYTPSATPSVTPTPTAAPPANCTAVPPDWQAVVILPDDNLATIAARYGTTEQALRAGNCLDTQTNQLIAGKDIFVPVPPPSPTPLSPTATLRPTRTSLPCGAPPGWVQYRVRPGDTLFSLSVRLGVAQAQIQSANCMGNSIGLIAGQLLWVPFIPLAPTIPPTWTPTLPPPTFTATPLPPTLTPTHTAPPPTRTSPPPTSTRVAPTNTQPAPTATLLPTNTPLPTDTPLPTVTPLPSDTAVPPSNTPIPSDTAVPPSNTPIPSDTVVPPSSTPIPSDTPVPATNTSQPAAPSDTALPTGNGALFLPPSLVIRPQLDASRRSTALFTQRSSWITLWLSIKPVENDILI